MIDVIVDASEILKLKLSKEAWNLKKLGKLSALSICNLLDRELRDVHGVNGGQADDALQRQDGHPAMNQRGCRAGVDSRC